jgi:uncharacterized protein involved in exopolysaccharide biosynthesis
MGSRGVTAAAVPSARADAPPIAEFIAHLRARRRGGAKIFAMSVAAGLLIAALVPARFRATATLAVLPAPEFTVREEAGSRTFNSSALALDQIMKAETEILESEDLHADTLADLGIGAVYPSLDPAVPRSLPVRLMSSIVGLLLSPWRVRPGNPVAALQDRALSRFADDLLVLPAKESDIITVSFGNRSGEVAARAINDLLARYAQRRGHLYDDPQVMVVRRETDALAVAVRDADAALASYKRVHAISDSFAERALLLHRQSDAAQALADAQAAGAEQHARLAVLDRQISEVSRPVPLYQEQDADTRLTAIDASLVDLRANLGVARTHYLDSSRRVTDLQAQLQVREAERAQMASQPNPSVVRAGRSLAVDPLLVDRAHAAAEQAAAAAHAAALLTELADVAGALARLEAAETSLAELARRKGVADANFAAASRVLAEQRLTEAEDALRMANVRVIQPARPPLRQTATRLLICLASVLLGAMAATLWFLVGYAARPTFLTGEGLAYATGLPVLGVFSAASGGDALVS